MFLGRTAYDRKQENIFLTVAYPLGGFPCSLSPVFSHSHSPSFLSLIPFLLLSHPPPTFRRVMFLSERGPKDSSADKVFDKALIQFPRTTENFEIMSFLGVL